MKRTRLDAPDIAMIKRWAESDGTAKDEEHGRYTYEDKGWIHEIVLLLIQERETRDDGF